MPFRKGILLKCMTSLQQASQAPGAPGSSTSLPRLLDPDHRGIPAGGTRPHAAGQKHEVARQKYEVTWWALSTRGFKSEKGPNPLAKTSKSTQDLDESRSCPPSAPCTRREQSAGESERSARNKQMVIWFD